MRENKRKKEPEIPRHTDESVSLIEKSDPSLTSSYLKSYRIVPPPSYLGLVMVLVMMLLTLLIVIMMVVIAVATSPPRVLVLNVNV